MLIKNISSQEGLLRRVVTILVVWLTSLNTFNEIKGTCLALCFQYRHAI